MGKENVIDNMPDLSSDEINRMVGMAQDYALVILRKGPASREDALRNDHLQLGHLQHLAKLQLSGKLILNGPILEENDILGISIYAATVQEARELADADPKVKEGYLTVEVIPWMAVTSSQMISVFKYLL